MQFLGIWVYLSFWDFLIFAENKQKREYIGIWLMGSGGIISFIWPGFCVKCRVTASFDVIYWGFSVCKVLGLLIIGFFILLLLFFVSYFLFVCWESVGKGWKKVLSYGLGGFSVLWVENQESRSINYLDSITIVVLQAFSLVTRNTFCIRFQILFLFLRFLPSNRGLRLKKLHFYCEALQESENCVILWILLLSMGCLYVTFECRFGHDPCLIGFVTRVVIRSGLPYFWLWPVGWCSIRFDNWKFWDNLNGRNTVSIR